MEENRKAEKKRSSFSGRLGYVLALSLIHI